MKKNTFTKITKFIAWRALGAFVFTAVAGTSLWALAAFSEPSSSPAASIQDFATNVLGANNADNSFDSSSVTANADGSVLERLETLESKSRATMISAESSSVTFAQASAYCRSLSAQAEYAIGSGSTTVIYTDWRLGTMSELANFVGLTASTNMIWSATAAEANYNNKNAWRSIRLSDGHIYNYLYNQSAVVRCVR